MMDDIELLFQIATEARNQGHHEWARVINMSVMHIKSLAQQIEHVQSINEQLTEEINRLRKQ